MKEHSYVEGWVFTFGLISQVYTNEFLAHLNGKCIVSGLFSTDMNTYKRSPLIDFLNADKLFRWTLRLLCFYVPRSATEITWSESHRSAMLYLLQTCQTSWKAQVHIIFSTQIKLLQLSEHVSWWLSLLDPGSGVIPVLRNISTIRKDKVTGKIHASSRENTHKLVWPLNRNWKGFWFFFQVPLQSFLSGGFT